MTNSPSIQLLITTDSDQTHVFSLLLMQGFRIKARLGCSVKDLLCHQIGLEESYVEDRIQTIFLNGKAVDNINNVLVNKGATLALSAAMPGLVGAIFRKSGYYSTLRQELSLHNNDIFFSSHDDICS